LPTQEIKNASLDRRLCVAIKWNVAAEDWCRVMFKVSDKYYGVGRLGDNAPASQFEILEVARCAIATSRATRRGAYGIAAAPGLEVK
jgi:hypothetical protein